MTWSLVAVGLIVGGILMIVFRRAYARAVRRQRVFVRDYGETGEKASRFVIIITGSGFIFFGIYYLLWVNDYI